MFYLSHSAPLILPSFIRCSKIVRFPLIRPSDLFTCNVFLIFSTLNTVWVHFDALPVECIWWVSLSFVCRIIHFILLFWLFRVLCCMMCFVLIVFLFLSLRFFFSANNFIHYEFRIVIITRLFCAHGKSFSFQKIMKINIYWAHYSFLGCTILFNKWAKVNFGFDFLFIH